MTGGRAAFPRRSAQRGASNDLVVAFQDEKNDVLRTFWLSMLIVSFWLAFGASKCGVFVMLLGVRKTRQAEKQRPQSVAIKKLEVDVVLRACLHPQQRMMAL